jgi:hypothetical protein
MPKIVPFEDDPVPFLDLLLARLQLSHDQQELLRAVVENRRIDQRLFLTIVAARFEQDRPVATDLPGVHVSLRADAEANLLVGFYPANETIELSGLALPLLARSKETAHVPDGRVVGGVELLGRLGLDADATGALAEGLSLRIELQSTAESRYRFFKEFPAHKGARDLLRKTLESYKLPHRVIQSPPARGEVVTRDFRGELALGAELGYGWSAGGSERFGEDLTGTDLTTTYNVEARLGAHVRFGLQGALNMIVRQSSLGGRWVNVSFVKAARRATDLGLNLNVEASLTTQSVDGRPAGAFIDGLLARSPLPDVIAKLKQFDTQAEIAGKLNELQQEAVDRITAAIVRFAGPTVKRLDDKYQDVLEEARSFVAQYHKFNADVLAFVEGAIERYARLADIDRAVDAIAKAASPEKLIETLAGPHAADVRRLLAITTEVLGIDLSQLSWLEDRFDELQTLIAAYRKKRSQIKQRLEQPFRRMREQLGVEQVIGRIEAFLANPTKTSLERLLDQKIVWLNEYLSSELGEVTSRLADRPKEVAKQLRKITRGYDDKLDKAKQALNEALNRKYALAASVAWRSVRDKETLASIDVNLRRAAGKKAYRRLLVGCVAEVLEDRLEHPDSIRFRKSYFLDRLVRGVTLRAVFNGRERVTVRDFLVEAKAVIEPTDSGEIWIQTSKVESRFRRQNRHAMINVSTLFEFAIEQLFERVGEKRLVSRGVDVGEYELRYAYVERPRADSVPADRVTDRLWQIYQSIDVKTVDGQAFEELEQSILAIAPFGPLGSPLYRFETSLTGEALERVFSVDPDDLAEDVVEAWDHTTFELFAHQPSMLQFYTDNRDAGGFTVNRVRQLSGLAGSELRNAVFLLNSREPFRRTMVKLHKEAFGRGRRQKIRGHLDGLGRLMNDLDTLESDLSRDFIMTLFAHLAGPEELGGSVVVEYRHPLAEPDSERRHQARAETPPPGS